MWSTEPNIDHAKKVFFYVENVAYMHAKDAQWPLAIGWRNVIG